MRNFTKLLIKSFVFGVFIINFKAQAAWFEDLKAMFESGKESEVLPIVEAHVGDIVHAPFTNILSRKTVLHEAAGRGFTATVIALLNAGAQVEARDTQGYTALDRALLGNFLETAQVIINHARQLNIRILDTVDRLGFTPLQRAVMGGNENQVAFLLNQGADRHLRSNLGTALDIAVTFEHNYPERATLFRNIINVLNGLPSETVQRDLIHEAQHDARTSSRRPSIGGILSGFMLGGSKQ